MYYIGYKDRVLKLDATVQDILTLIRDRAALWQKFDSPYIRIKEKGEGEVERRFDIMRSKPGHVMCQECLEEVALDKVQEHKCTAWWSTDNKEV